MPTDPIKTGCSVSATEFNTWFETGAVSLNGVVKPADSVNFPDTPNCSFYKWAEQMFLWVNSPIPPAYGGGPGRIFNSSAFYDVSPLDANDDRTFTPHPSGNPTVSELSMRAAQLGSHGLPVIMDERGTMLEIERPPLGPTGKQLIINERGDSVEIERIAMGDNKNPIFFDGAGHVIPRPKPLVRETLKDANPALIAQKFVSEKNVPVFLNLNGNPVQVSSGQADGAVLMAQNGSLVYYIPMVNDVYAYFLTGAKKGAIQPGNKFPTTQIQLDQVKQFAIWQGGKPGPEPFPDPEALAVEIKTAWVEAAGLTNPGSYITMNARIPTYSKGVDPSTNLELWVPNGKKVVLMALAGMHVVGSVAGHPEMIWATFEHENNAPNATYTYISTSGVKTVNPDFSGAFLFCAANPDISHLNEFHMLDYPDPQNLGSIIARSTFTISPSNTIRGNPWGATAQDAPNPVPNLTSASVSRSNSELISINNDVRGMLKSGDVRRNYFMTGGVWTINGGIPFENFGKPDNIVFTDGTVVGTNQLASTVMETYQQALIPGTHQTMFDKNSNNCFSCHSTNTVEVSHIYWTPGKKPHGLKPLF